MHSIEQEHFLFIHLTTAKVYCLPDNYEVKDKYLDDIKHNLNPAFSVDEIANMGKSLKVYKDVSRNEYIPGYCGVHEIGESDYMTCILMVFAQIPELRTYLLKQENQSVIKTSIFLTALHDFTSSVWNNKKFSHLINPGKILADISTFSNKRYLINQRSDAFKFLTYILNQIESRVLDSCCLSLELPEFLLYNNSKVEINQGLLNMTAKEKESINLITEVDIYDLFNKDTKVKDSEYLFIHINRFVKTKYEIQKNPILITYPHALDISKYYSNLDSENIGIGELVSIAQKHNIDIEDKTKQEIIDLIQKQKQRLNKKSSYELMALIEHDSNISMDNETYKNSKMNPIRNGKYRVRVKNSPNDTWFEINGNQVRKLMPQEIGSSQVYILLYKKQNT